MTLVIGDVRERAPYRNYVLRGVMREWGSGQNPTVVGWQRIRRFQPAPVDPENPFIEATAQGAADGSEGTLSQ